jgi:hypothetical protein
LDAGPDGLRITPTSAPQFLTPQQPNDLLRIAAAWDRAPLEVVKRRQEWIAIPLRYRNPTSTTYELHNVEGSWKLKPGDELVGSTRLFFKNVTLRQYEEFEVTNAVRVSLRPPPTDHLLVFVDNPSAEAFRGDIKVYGILNTDKPVTLENGERSKFVSIPWTTKESSPINIELLDEHATSIDHVRYAALVGLSDAESHYAIAGDGDSKVRSWQSLSNNKSDAPAPLATGDPLQIEYRFDPGWKFVCVRPKSPHDRVNGKPTHLAMWLKGDGSGNIPRMRFVDATGQTFQPDAEKLTYTDWRYVELPLDASQGGHWGGVNDGKIHYPIRLETLLLIDSAARQKTEGTVCLSSPTLIYSE